MSASPPHTLQESPNSRSISISDWYITASTNPISNAPECDALHASLGIPLPEMTFGNNYLTLVHKPSEAAYAFTTPEALRTVKKGELGDGDGGVKVGYAEKWMRSRQVSYIPACSQMSGTQRASTQDRSVFNDTYAQDCSYQAV